MKTKLFTVACVWLAALTPSHARMSAASANPADSIVCDTLNRTIGLDNVTVVASRVVHKANGFSINLAGSKLSDVLSLDQMMSMLPYIDSKDGAISIYNQAASAVYIDGVKVTNNEQLRILRPELIERIEVDYFNTGSESAGSSGGVMRIWLKHREKGYVAGLSGSTSARTETGYDGYNTSAYLMASGGRFTVYNSMAYNRGLTSFENKTYSQLGDVMSASSERRMRNSDFAGDWLSVSADVGHNQLVGLTGGFTYYRNRGSLSATVAESGGTAPATTQTVTWQPVKNMKINGTAFYNWKINDIGSNLNVTADYLWYKRNREDNVNIITADGLMPDFSQNSYNYTKLFRIKSTWLNMQRNGNSLSAGLDYQLRDYSETERVLGMNNEVIDNEPAAFASYSGSVGRLTYNANMRVQYNSLDVTANGHTDKRDYWSLCPSAVLRYEISKKHKHRLSLTYQRTVNGLPYDGISTYRKYDGANHYTIGNPDIDVPSRHTVRLELTLFNRLNLGFSYVTDENSLFYAEEADPETPGATRSVLRNSGEYNSKKIYLQWSGYPLKWLYFKLYGHAGWDTFKQPGFGYTNSFRWYMSAVCAMWLKNDFAIELNGFYDPKRYTDEIHCNTVWDLKVGVAKSFMKKKLQVAMFFIPPTNPRVTKVNKEGLAYRRENVSCGAIVELQAAYTISGGKVRQRKKAQSIQQYEETNHNY